MKAIKIFTVLFAAILLGCKTNDDASFDSLDVSFVRFSLLVDNNGNALQYPQNNGSLLEVDEYVHNTVNTIKIPIKLSTSNELNVNVDYSIEANGSFAEYSVTPQSTVQLSSEKPVDTIFIRFSGRWNDTEENSLNFAITGVNNNKVAIGWPRDANKKDKLKVTLGNLEKVTYQLSTNLVNLAGNLNEEAFVDVLFAQPIYNADLENVALFTETFEAISVCDGDGATFNYALEQLPFEEGATKVTYKLTVLETTPFEANLQLSLVESFGQNFELSGQAVTQFRKAANSVRSGNPASNWHNISDPLHRTWGEGWIFDATDNRCEWSNFNAFTKPVAVPPGSEFDNGNGYHKYKIGFVGNNPPIGTNPFNFRRFYTNASVSSPAYTLAEALEFFPENTNSTVKGLVKVIPQTLSFVRSSDDVTFAVPICGNGTYEFNAANNRWEMFLEIHSDETQLNGLNDVVRYMYIFTVNSSTDPPNLAEPCAAPIVL